MTRIAVASDLHIEFERNGAPDSAAARFRPAIIEV